MNLLKITALLVCSTTAIQAQAPIDASDTDLVPSLFAEAGPDGSLDVAWRSSDGRLMLSTFSGPGFRAGQHTPLATNLQLLGGLARDEAGNRYIAAYRDEQASPEEWAAKYRPGVANVLRVPAGSNQTTLLADVNQQQFSQKWPIVNPLRMANTAMINGEMVYANGALALSLGHNNGAAADIHNTGLVVGVGTDGSALYGGGGEQHSGHIRLAVDGGNFLQAQTNDLGIGLSTLKRNGDKYVWSNFVLVYEIPRANKHEEALSIAGIVPTPDSYLLIFSSGKGWLWTFRQIEQGGAGACEIKMLRVARNFDTLPKLDWWAGIRTAQGNFPLMNIAVPAGDKSYLRPIVTPLADGRSIVAYEQWGKPNEFTQPAAEGVRAVLLDANGNVQRQSELFAGLRIQRSTRGTYLPTLGRMGWVNGDAQGNRLMLHTLDANLALASFELGRGAINASQPSSDTPPPVAPLAALFNVAGDWEAEGITFPFQLSATPQGLSFVSSNRTTTWSPVANQPNSYRHDNAADFSLVFTSANAGTLTASGKAYTIRRRAAPNAGPAIPAPGETPLTVNSIVGSYQHDPVVNEWHRGRLSLNQNNTLTWTNGAGVSWTLTPDLANKSLRTGPDNPYQTENIRDFAIELENRNVVGFRFGGDLYKKIGN